MVDLKTWLSQQDLSVRELAFQLEVPLNVDPPGFIGLVESSALYTVPPSYSTVHDGTAGPPWLA